MKAMNGYYRYSNYYSILMYCKQADDQLTLRQTLTIQYSIIVVGILITSMIML